MKDADLEPQYFYSFFHGTRTITPKEEEACSSNKKTTSSYTLKLNDNPVNIIIQIQLREENYNEWERAIQTDLRAERNYEFIDGIVKHSEKDHAVKLMLFS